MSWPCPQGFNITVNMTAKCNCSCSHLATLVLRSRIFLPWRWRRYVPPKRRLTQDLHSATSQKTTFFIVTAMKASNLTGINIFLKHPTMCFSQRRDQISNTHRRGSRSQWPRGLRHEMSSPAQTMGLWVQIQLKARMSAFILCLCCPV
jgi:hypothetical protein